MREATPAIDVDGPCRDRSIHPTSQDAARTGHHRPGQRDIEGIAAVRTGPVYASRSWLAAALNHLPVERPLLDSVEGSDSPLMVVLIVLHVVDRHAVTTHQG